MPRAEAPIVSLSSACLVHLPLHTTFRLAAETGYDGLELVIGPEALLRGARYVERIAREHGLMISSVHQALYRLRPETWRDVRLERATRMALELGCPHVVIHNPWATNWNDPAAQRWLRELERCRRIATGSGTQLTLENPGLYSKIDARNVLATYSALLGFAQQHDLGLTFDTCHAGSNQTGVLQAYEQLSARIANVHLSDLRPVPAQSSHLWRTVASHHQFPGEGHLPLTEMLQRMVADGYTGPIALEVSLFALRFWSPSTQRRRLAEAVGFVRSALQAGTSKETSLIGLAEAPHARLA